MQNQSLRIRFRPEYSKPDVLYLLGWKQPMHPWQGCHLRADEVRRLQSSRRDNLLPHFVGENVWRLKCEIVAYRGCTRLKVMAVLLSQRFWNGCPLAGLDLWSQLDHRGVNATGFEAGDLDAERSQLHTEVSGHDLQRCLRRRVAEYIGMVM
jgi:hypothetical protein